jgi:predicted phage tail protein
MLREIRLYGALAKFIGKRVLHADVKTAAEAVRFLVANWPGVEHHMAERHYRVTLTDYDLTLQNLHDPVGRQTIKITPVVAGAGGGSATSILIGAALIGASFLFPGAGAFGAGFGVFGPLAPGAIATLTSVGTTLSLVGASLVIGGIAGLIAPVPKLDDDASDPRKSFSFSGIQNTSRQGLAVPIIYGETIVGSIIASASIDIVQVVAGEEVTASTSTGNKTKA